MPSHSVIGVDLGGTKVSVGRIGDGVIQQVVTRPVSASAAAEVVLDEICSCIDAVLDDAVVGIGCGVPSLVDVDEGIVYAVENIPSWQRVPVKRYLEQRFSLPAYVNNDANTFALGEAYFGVGKGVRHLVGVTLGTGMGTGVVINGHLYCGANCGAGEIGMIPREGGILEHFCASQFFSERAGASAKTLHDRALAGDQESRSVFAAYGREVGTALMMVMYAYDPEMIVLGGSITRALPLFSASMYKRLEDYAYQHALARTRIVPSETDNVALLGAAALYYDAQPQR